MATHWHLAPAGYPSKLSCKWCNYGGANHSIYNGITDFTSHSLEVTINLTVAKHNFSMQAVGNGDCLVHCNDNFGRPCKIMIKNVLHVFSTASCKLMLASAMALSGFQTVLPSMQLQPNCRQLSSSFCIQAKGAQLLCNRW